MTYGFARRRGNHTAAAWWFVVAPLGAVVTLALLYSDAPPRLRWQFGKGQFEQALSSIHKDPATWQQWRTRRVGTYQITHVQMVERGVIFYEREGALLDDAGFAYLPGGPSADMADGNFENPQWVPLGDHWYGWTASW